MTWICPTCQRVFSHLNQAHSCGVFPLEVHFQKKHEALKVLWDRLHETISGFGEVRVCSLKNAIILSGKSSFAAFKTRKEYAELEILMDEEFNEFPVYKTFRVSKSRVAHFIRLQAPEEVDEQLKDWLKKAYDRVGN